MHPESGAGETYLCRSYIAGHFGYGDYIALAGWILLGYCGSFAARQENVGTGTLARAGGAKRD